MRNDRRGRPKVPVQKVEVTRRKEPRVPPRQKQSDMPAWRFGLCDHGGPFKWDWTSLATHLDKLCHFEDNSWGEISGTGTVGAKEIPLDSLGPAALKRLRALEYDDAESLWELRVGGAPRFWGVRTGNCLHFLWWDPKHLVCPTKK